MATKEKNSTMIFYESYMLSAQEAQLTPAQRCEFYEALMHYVYYQEMPHFDCLIMRCLFSAFKVNVDNNIRKLARHRAAVENGKKGGGQPGNLNACKSEEKRAKKRANDENKTTISISTSNSTSTSTSISNSTSMSVKDEPSTQKHFEKLKEEESSKEEYPSLPSCQKSLQERNVDFYQSLLPYISTYGVDRIRKFYEYWVEPTQDRLRLRFENEKNWNLEARLNRWKD